MALNPKQTDEAANAAADAVVALANSGKVRIYDGTQPATAATAVSTQTLLAELTLANPAFGAAVAGVATANAITADSTADASGTATWFRLVKSDGTTVLWDGTVGTGTHDLVINTTAIEAGANVAISALTYTISKG